MSSPQQQDVYPDDPRADVAPFVPREFRNALEVGCGKGGFGPTLRAAAPEARLVGIEAVPGVTDAGGNTASDNGNPDQCTNLTCR